MCFVWSCSWTPFLENGKIWYLSLTSHPIPLPFLSCFIHKHVPSMKFLISRFEKSLNIQKEIFSFFFKTPVIWIFASNCSLQCYLLKKNHIAVVFLLILQHVSAGLPYGILVVNWLFTKYKKNNGKLTWLKESTKCFFYRIRM